VKFSSFFLAKRSCGGCERRDRLEAVAGLTQHQQGATNVIPINQETLISLAEAAQSIPPGRKGKPTHLSTVLRWILHGVHGIRLEGVRLGGRWLTSREALARFAEQLTARAEPAAIQVTSPSDRKRDGQFAERELDRIGI
jgi:hypothetical protein